LFFGRRFPLEANTTDVQAQDGGLMLDVSLPGGLAHPIVAISMSQSGTAFSSVIVAGNIDLQDFSCSRRRAEPEV